MLKIFKESVEQKMLETSALISLYVKLTYWMKCWKNVALLLIGLFAECSILCPFVDDYYIYIVIIRFRTHVYFDYCKRLSVKYPNIQYP